MSTQRTLNLRYQPGFLSWINTKANSMHFIIIIQLIIISTRTAISVAAAQEDSYEFNTDTLQQVHLIFRHGLRSPEKPYPGDPYNETSHWPHGWGQLTNEGKRQQYELGRFIRQLYNKFLGSSFRRNEFQATSSDSDRTVVSLLANLAGLFPPNAEDPWIHQDHIQGWQPIPFRTLTKQSDRTIQAKAKCPKMNQLWQELLASQEFLDENQNYKDLYDYIGSHTGEKYAFPIDLTVFYEALIIQEAHNLSLPEWTREVYPTQKSSDFLAFAFNLSVYKEEMKRLGGGPLLSEMFSNIKDKVENSNKIKMVMYSGHDMTIVRTLSILNIFDPPHLPDFNSLIMIELHRNESTNIRDPSSSSSNLNDQFHIKIYYRNGANKKPTRMDIKDCPEPCTITKFERLYKHRLITPEEWTQECFGNDGEAKREVRPTTGETTTQKESIKKSDSNDISEYDYTLGFWSNFYNGGLDMI